MQNEAIKSIKVRIGAFRNVDPESLLFAFQSLKGESDLTRDCDLLIEPVSAVARCSISGHEYHPLAEEYYCCTICGGGIGELICGKELDIVEVKINA